MIKTKTLRQKCKEARGFAICPESSGEVDVDFF
jgi:hypothetical protein